ncbi:MAG TPA: hypothetical protein VFI22_18505, partial [Thermomicrobiales bacterium]|nr:hypothetical protein [Thermomicrobiales bacterium]
MISVGEVPVAFAGSADEQAFAGRLLGLLRTHGRFMAADAPIRVSIASVAEFMQSTGEERVEARIDAAIDANPTIFARETVDGEPYVLTTRAGRLPVDRAVSVNTFA